MEDSTSLSKMSTDFGKRIKAARKHADLTQVELSKAIGIKQSSLSHLESTAFCSTHTTQIAKACKVDPNWLATGEGEMLQRTTPDQAVPTTPSVSAASTKMSLGQTLARLGQELGRASPQTRAAVADLLSRYAQNPAQGQSLAQAIEMLVQSDTEKKADA